MKFFIFVGTLAAVTNAFSPAPGLSHHYSAKTTLGKNNVHHYARHAPSSFQCAVKGGESFLIPPPRNNSLLDMSSSDSDEEAKHANSEAEDGDDKKMAKKVVGRKKRVVVGYTLASVLYLLTAVRAILTQNNQLSVGTIAYASCGSVLASGLAFIQKGAAENDRLRSDTYKRLNIFMAWHGFLVSIITLKALFGPDPLALMTNVIAMVNSIKGYGYGARGWTLREGVPFVEDLTQVVKNTVQGMIGSFPQNMKSIGYFLGTATVGTLKISKGMEVGKLLIQSGGSISFLVGTRLFRCTKLGLLAVCMYNLKDAADRDRLNGTTFIQLNFLCSLVWASMAYYIYERYPLALLGTRATLRPTITAALAGFLALFTASNGILSIAEKKNA